MERAFVQGSVSDPDLDPFHETNPGVKKSAKIIEYFHKNQQKTQEYHAFFSKILIFCLMDINIYLINNKTNHFSEKKIYYLLEKKLLFSSLQVGYGAGSGSGSKSVIPRTRSEDPDPDQNKTNPKHLFKVSL